MSAPAAARGAWALLVGAAAAIAACGGSDAAPSAPPPSDGANDAGADADDPGSDTYPAPHHLQPLMQDLGGPVLKNVEVVTVTFEGSAFAGAIRTFDDAIVTGPWWTAVTDGYGVGPGTSGGASVLPDTVSGRTLSDEVDLPQLIQSSLDAGELPTPDANTLYAIYFPVATTITLGSDKSCQAFGAYHNSTTVKLEGGAFEVAYAVMPDCVATGTVDTGFDTVAASHEIIEAATDPHPQTGTAFYNWNDPWNASDQGGEVADLCEGRGTATFGPWDVATAWSNPAILAGRNPCQPATKPYFGAAIDTETLRSDWGTGLDHESDGYVLVHPGETKVVNVDVFSEAPLPHDLALVAGAPTTMTDDPTKMVGIQGITLGLSRQTARNGHRVQLTIAADRTAPLGDTLFGVRAILEKDDYHTWWAILHIL